MRIMKNIVHVHEKFYPFMGGSTHRLLNLLEGLNEKEYKITVICENSERIEKECIYKNIKIIRYNKYFEIIKILFKIAKKEEIDIIHTHNFRPTLYAYIANIFIKKKILMEMHSIYKTTNFIKEYLGKKLLKKISPIIVLSNNSKEYLIKYYGLKKEKIKVIYNGLNFKSEEIYDSIKDSELKEIFNKTELKILYIGSLDAFQGVNEFIEIANYSKNENFYFILIGGNEQEIDELKKKIKTPKIYCRSFLDKKYVNEIYKSADLLLMTRPNITATQTAIPLKPLEALYNKIQVISSKVDGMVELKKTLETENIIFFSNLKELNTILKNYKKNFQEEKKISLFSREVQSKELEKIYKGILEDEY